MAKEQDFTRSLLMYAVTCLQHGDTSALRGMGFTERAAQAVGDLTVNQLVAMVGRINPKVVRTSLDDEAFWEFIGQMKRETELERIKNELVQRDAPVAMLQELFGIGAKQYAVMRKAIGAAPGVGRPSGLAEEEVHAVWHTWERIVGNGRPSPEHFLQIAEETGVSMRALWRLAQGWKAAHARRTRQDPQEGPSGGIQASADHGSEP